MPGKPHYTPQQVIDALHALHGLVFLTAKSLGCTPETVQNYCKRYPSVMAAKEAARGELVDLAEAKLWQSVERGEAWGVSLVLRTLGRDRGYGDKTEITGPDGGPIQHAHIHVWQERLQAAHNAIEARRQAALPEGTNGTQESL